jgi:hypothetical protein
MKLKTSLICCSFILKLSFTKAQSSKDSTEIKQCALNYIEGWYEGNGARMEKALHPELAKRNVTSTGNGESFLTQMGALTLINYTKEGYSAKVSSGKRQFKEVIILDIFQNAASVRINATEWVDYLHLVKWNGEWKIINVYWENRPKEQGGK